ncbi:hypothetical protein FXF51_02320 [Nonomuraea sp. PA05]|uniref:hypothetical protein n=1 Tax=Nonomuraea sp. PA05 TaxID=2604466 RepID=UPI0011D766FE|nr:hypothetical protein [Nonomuraea sp. PA05]TYB71289.1 hypothetical protein FXF51_02320 [Nonomuraea sp. PA05]
MQGSHAQSYAQLISERVAEIPLPAEAAWFRDPEVLIAGDGIEVAIAAPVAGRPRPVLTVGERLAVEAPRDVVKGIVAVHLARVHLGTPELAGLWAPFLLGCSTIVALFGLLIGLAPFLFVGGIGLIFSVLGWRSRIESAHALRGRVHEADELAVSWVGRQSVTEALRWLAGRSNHSHLGGGRLDPPTLNDRLTRLGA